MAVIEMGVTIESMFYEIQSDSTGEIFATAFHIT
jgi:hypothetical protein